LRETAWASFFPGRHLCFFPDRLRPCARERFELNFITEDQLRDDSLRLCCRTDACLNTFSKPIPLAAVPSDKAARLARIRPLLRSDLPCRETPFHFDFLTPEARQRFQVMDTTNVSDFAYAPYVQSLIDQCGEGLVLDCGAGYRHRCLPNVVNLEIAAFPSTDVLAANEQLPFKDGSFDLVISCAVLEHVRYPFEAAKEIIRVTKPGGMIYADVPFLQPYHGYPSHFYNMTWQGLENLFSESCDIERNFVPHYGVPIWTLSWFLNSYLEGLPEAERKAFADMKVSDLLGKPVEYLEKDFVAKLSAEKNRELACVNSVLARKRQSLDEKKPPHRSLLGRLFVRR
jgi:SAM-dependent methyltransferase